MDKLTKPHPRLKVLTYATKYPDTYSEVHEDATIFFDTLVTDVSVIDWRKDAEGYVAHCANLLEDTVMEQKVNNLKIDVVLLGIFEFTRCYFILPYRLGLPFISVTTALEPWVTRSPSLPSFVPFQLQVPPLTPEMTFWERLTNFKESISWVFYVDQIPMSSDELVMKYAPNKPAVSMNYLAGLSLLWLVDNDLVIDYPRTHDAK